MTIQQITTVNTEDIRSALGDASMALGKAGGLASVCCALIEGRRDKFDIESILRSVRCQLEKAAELVQDIAQPSLLVCEARAVCDLVIVDAEDSLHAPDSPSMWALEALPDAISRAKEAVDAAYPIK